MAHKVRNYNSRLLCLCYSDNLLINKYPEIVKHWNIKKNKDVDLNTVTCGSSKKAYWKCPKCGKEDFCIVSGKVRKYNSGFFCKCYCKNLLIIKYPEIAKQWDNSKNKNIDLNTVTSSSTKKVYWKCTICDLSYNSSVYSRIFNYKKYNTNGCFYCHGKEEHLVKTNLKGVFSKQFFNKYHNSKSINKK